MAAGRIIGVAHVASNAEEAAAVRGRDPRAFITEPSGSDDVARVMGEVEVTRALGDKMYKPALSATPDFTVEARHADQVLLVVATDGMWSAVNPMQVVRPSL